MANDVTDADLVTDDAVAVLALSPVRGWPNVRECVCGAFIWHNDRHSHAATCAELRAYVTREGK